MIREQGEARLQIEQKLREIADAQARHRAGLHRGLNETLHQAAEQQMTSSFARVHPQRLAEFPIVSAQSYFSLLTTTDIGMRIISSLCRLEHFQPDWNRPI
jgi:hypothetical protein